VGIKYSDVQDVAEYFDYTQIYEIKQIPNLAIASKEFPPATLDYKFYFYDASIGSGVFEKFPGWVKEKAEKIGFKELKK
ncbi:hypothetical protein, partial [Arcobacter sp.]|uniref:hypothetical protein n=1 Tax=Arcobacter sp. TaxID=1872629 RepID=UPI003D11750F